MPTITEEQLRRALDQGAKIDDRYSVDKSTDLLPAQRRNAPNYVPAIAPNSTPQTTPLPPTKLERPALRKGIPAPLEHDEQTSLFRFVDQWAERYPLLKLLFAIPNGAKLPYSKNAKGQRYSKQAKILIDEGLRSGVPDLCLPVPSLGKHGLFIEMKRADRSNHPSPEQQWWIYQLGMVGYQCSVCYGATEAWEVIKVYLGIDKDLGLPGQG